MRFSVICIISLGLSLAVLGDAERHDSHHSDRSYDERHLSNSHANGDHAHSKHNTYGSHADKHHADKVQHQNSKQRHSQGEQHHHHSAKDYHIVPDFIPGISYIPDGKDQEFYPAALVIPSSPLASNKDEALIQPPTEPVEEQRIHPQKKGKMVVAYWTDWTSGSMSPEAIPFEKITHLNYAFSIVTPDFRPVFETDYLLTRVVSLAHAKNVKVLISIGGWTGSQYFSPLSASESGRKTFIDGAVNMVKEFNLDGIDIDWEYPGRLGSACNVYDEANDAKNFLILLQELRTALSALPNGKNLEISLATRIVPFDGPNGQLQDVSAFSKLVNHINIMAYDINGSWSSATGPNAPLVGPGEFTCEGGAQAWINAGFPAQQINMGVPFYGRSLITTTDQSQSENMGAPFQKGVPMGDGDDALWTDPCEKTSAYSGVWKYRNLRDQSLIDANGNAIGPWQRKFDQGSQTPWLYNPTTRQFISYDDKESLRLKVNYAKGKGLGGMMLWALNQDTSNFELLDELQGIHS